MARLRLFRDLNRAREIAGVLLKYRFDEILEHIEAPPAWLVRIVPPVKGQYTLPERVRFAVEELGPLWVKGAQILSTRPDILPPDLVNEFKFLRDRVTALPFEQVRPLVEAELGCPCEEVFSTIEPTARAAGSLAQVHFARLKLSGIAVAVKIQRPNLKRPIQTDFEIAAYLAGQMHKNLPSLRPFDLPSVVRELREAVVQELDFRIEARNAELFSALNRDPRVFAPRVHEAYTTPRLLVADWIDGTPVEAFAANPDGPRLAALGGRSFFAQIVSAGFFHGDPHPGNLLVTPDGRLCFLDWGLVGQVTRHMRFDLVDLFTACRERRPDRVTRIALRMARGNRRIDAAELEKSVTSILFKHAENLSRMRDVGRVIFELIYVFGSHGVHVARDYTLLAKAVISIEDTSTKLDPDFNLGSVAEPFIREVAWERWNPLKLGGHLLEDARDRLDRLVELPDDLQRVLRQVQDKELSLNLEHRGIGEFGRTLDAAFSRLALAILVAALIVGSSLVVDRQVGPTVRGVSILGLGGYLLSFLMGVFAIIDILRHRRHR